MAGPIQTRESGKPSKLLCKTTKNQIRNLGPEQHQNTGTRNSPTQNTSMQEALRFIVLNHNHNRRGGKGEGEGPWEPTPQRTRVGEGGGMRGLAALRHMWHICFLAVLYSTLLCTFNGASD